VKPVLVTGASGFLGWHVARQLIERGERVRALVRPTSRLRELEGVEAVTGDLREPDSLERAVAGCGVVYHVAADYRLWAPDSSKMFRSNVDGTRNLLMTARSAGVECFVHTSTVGCIGVPAGGLGREETPLDPADLVGPYKRSKFLAEQAALEFAATGFPVVIVNPTAPIGDHDWKPTPTGKIMVDFLRRCMPAYVDTGLNLVDAGDVAAGHLLAAGRGRVGERYILGGENLTLREIFQKMETVSGIPAAVVRLPYAVAWAAGVCSTAWARLTGSAPRVPLDGVRMSRKKMFASSEKAARELGYSPRPVEAALASAVAWFRANGYC